MGFMKLSQVRTKEEYVIEKIEIDAITKTRLQVLGILKKTKIQILNKREDGLVIKVRGTRLGIDKQIADKIYVAQIHKVERRTNEKVKHCFYRQS